MHIFNNNERHITKKIICSVFFVLLIISCPKTKITKIQVEINKKTYSFEIASTPNERKLGLMYRKNLDKNSGMLFIYPYEAKLSFYMKNTLIPLDIAFMDKNLKILNIEKMEPLSLTSIESNGNAQYALEVNRGFFEKTGLKSGDKIEIITPIPSSTE